MNGNNKKVAAILIVGYGTGDAFIERSEAGSRNNDHHQIGKKMMYVRTNHGGSERRITLSEMTRNRSYRWMDSFTALTARIRNGGRDGRETVTGRSRQQHTPAMTSKPTTPDKQNPLPHPRIGVILTLRSFITLIFGVVIPYWLSLVESHKRDSRARGRRLRGCITIVAVSFDHFRRVHVGERAIRVCEDRIAGTCAK